MSKPSLGVSAVSLIGVSAIVIGALLLRNHLVGDHGYNFLLWNLFLGFVPLCFAAVLVQIGKRFGSLAFWVIAGLWLLFYPNAPYMLTDFIHVDPQKGYVLYDALLIFCLAILSTFYGLYSLKLVKEITRNEYGAKLSYTVIGASIVLAAFGIYLGRILRLNSWDVFTKPLETLKAIAEHLFPVEQNLQTWAIIVIFTALQYFLLFLVRGMESK